MIGARARNAAPVAALIAALILAAPSARAEVDATTQAALARLPGNALIVASLDVKAVRKTAMFRKAASAAEKDAELKSGAAALRAQVGFDYKRHLDRLYLVVPADAIDGAERMAFLAKVTVNQARFLTWLRTVEKVEEKSSSKITWYKADDSAIAFLGDGWVLVAHTNYVDEILKAHASGAGRAIDDGQMMAAVRSAARGKNHAWIASVLPAAMRSKLKGDTFTSSLGDLEWSAGAATFGKKVVFRGEMRAATAESATSIAGLLTQMVQLVAGSKDLADAGLTTAVSGAVISSKDRTVSISGSIASSKLSAAMGRIFSR
jgi:hypothetical protein